MLYRQCIGSWGCLASILRLGSTLINETCPMTLEGIVFQRMCGGNDYLIQSSISKNKYNFAMFLGTTSDSKCVNLLNYGDGNSNTEMIRLF